ncbi:MAG: patatin-like phospholipase family protein [Patescibacteria group bacterium]
MNITYAHLGKIGIVLCGGGYKGLLQAIQLLVFMKWLEERGLKLSHITASSVGAYNAIALAENPSYQGAQKLWRVWEEVLMLGEWFYVVHPILEEKLKRFLPHSPFHRHGSWRELFDDCQNQLLNLMNFVCFVGRLFWTGTHVLFNGRLPASSKKIGDVINHFFGISSKAFFDPSPLLTIVRKRIDFQKVIDSPVELSISTLRFSNRKQVIFSNHDSGMHPDRIFQCVLASAALYPFFEMVKIDNIEYEDGDIADPLPIEVAFHAQCDTVFVFLNTPARLERTRGTLIEDLLEQAVVNNHKLLSEGLVKSQRSAKTNGKNLFIFRPMTIHKDLGTLSITSPDAVEFHKIQDTQDVENYLGNIEKYNLRYLPDIEEYRADSNAYKNLDSDIQRYLKNL